jgi:hypothetical protein
LAASPVWETLTEAAKAVELLYPRLPARDQIDALFEALSVMPPPVMVVVFEVALDCPMTALVVSRMTLAMSDPRPATPF